MGTVVISAFYGATGYTEIESADGTLLKIDTLYPLYTGKTHKEIVNNINNIVNKGKYKYLVIDYDVDIMEELDELGIEYIFAINDNKNKFMRRCINRGIPYKGISRIYRNWDSLYATIKRNALHTPSIELYENEDIIELLCEIIE